MIIIIIMIIICNKYVHLQKEYKRRRRSDPQALTSSARARASGHVSTCSARAAHVKEDLSRGFADQHRLPADVL